MSFVFQWETDSILIALREKRLSGSSEQGILTFSRDVDSYILFVEKRFWFDRISSVKAGNLITQVGYLPLSTQITLFHHIIVD